MESKMIDQPPIARQLFGDLDGDTPSGGLRTLSDFYRETPENGTVMLISTPGSDFRNLMDMCRWATQIGWAIVRQMPLWKQLTREQQQLVQRKAKLKRLKNKRRRRAAKARRKRG